MPISGKLIADFGSFYTEVLKAEGSLRSFESNAGKVEKALNKMVDQFSGRTVIQDATLMSEAIQRVGGVSVLTGDELKAAGAKAAEAADKMKRLGMEVPPGIRDIAAAAQAAEPAIKEMGDAAKPIPSIFQQIKGALGPLGPAVLGAFSIGAVVAFGKQVFDSADSLVKLSDKTGIGTVALQQLQGIAADAGNTLEEVTSAVTQMQRRIAGGDQSAVSALDSLGISLAQLRGLAPEKQFYTIGQAIAGVQDPAERTRLAIEIFGRSGAEILPTMRSNMQGIADATVTMSDDTVKALDRAGDAWEKFKRDAVAAAGTVLGAIVRANEKFDKEIDREIERQRILNTVTADTATILGLVKKPQLEVAEGYKFVAPTTADLIDLNFQLDMQREKTNRLRDETEKAAAAQQKFLDSIKNTTSSSVGAVAGFGAFGRLMPELTGDTQGWREELELLSSTDLPNVKSRLQDIGMEGRVFKELTDKARTFGDYLKRDLGADILKVFQGGGHALTAIGGSIGGFLTGTTSKIGQGLSKGIAEVFGSSFGGALNTVLPGIGTLLGAGIGKLFGKLFDNPEKQINPLRQAFVDAAGGLDQLNRRAHEAGVTLDRVLDAKNPKQYQKAIEDLNAAFAFQDQAMQFLNATVEKYGFSISELGPTLANQKLGEQAAQLQKEWYALAAGGIDLNNISIHMGDSVSKWLQNSLKAGTEIPGSMREILHQLAAVGLLTDENGDKYDLAKIDALDYSKTSKGAMADLQTAIEKLTDAISRGLGGAIKNLPKDFDVTGHVHVENDFNGLPPIVPESSGGMGRVTKPTLFLVGERGSEDFAFSGGGQSFGGGGRDAALLRLLADQPAAIARAMRNELQKIVRAA